MFLELTLLALSFPCGLQTHAGMSSRTIYINHQTCGSSINLSASESLYLDYHGSELDFNRTDNGRHKKFVCIIDIETQDGAEQTCIETEQTLLKEGCTLRFMWHSGSRDFMLYGLSTYWCDMFMYGSICMPVWRSRLRLDTSETAALRIRFSTKRKASIKTIFEQPEHTNVNKPFLYGLRGRLSFDFYIVLTAFVFVCACVSVTAVMRHMKKRANRRRILSTNIELAQLDQTLTVQRNFSPNDASRNVAQQRFPPHVFSNTETKNSISHAAYSGDVTVPPPYLENPPPYS
ncbi:uncharacterized protein LOC123529435 [Mercenaria mercenaria]|uniref:uncharacterized protein LOC123529435 n=1 Tax=Mercenaria mercenaria TaxID=6596 RepID=UPI00234E6C6B|nr:uncharacterized protein LOC123529435 [Mercenaria mercenaria]